MESVLEDLCSRIFDIQMCLECAANGGADERHIQELTAEMCKIENELQIIDEEVSAQMPLVNRVESLIGRLQEVHRVSSEIQQPETELLFSDDDNDPQEIPVQHQAVAQPKAKKITEQSTRKSVSRIPTKANDTATKKESAKGKQNVTYFRPIDESEIKKQMMYKASADVLNKCIQEMNALLEKKYSLINTTKSRIPIHDDGLYKKVEEDIEQGFGISITSADIQNLPSLKKNQKKFLGALNELGRITSSTTGAITRYYPKE